MKFFWKGMAALSLAVAGLGAAAVPAQAHDDRYGWRGDRDGRWDGRRWDGRRWDDRRWEGRRWDDRRHWRGDRRDWRGYDRRYAYRQRCWTEWRYDYYRHRDVRVRICR